MTFYSLLFLYHIFIFWFIFLFIRYKISLYTSVYIIYTLLIGIPFFIIYAEIENVFLISNVLGRTIDAKVSLSMGDGLTPIIYLLVFNLIYLLLGTVFSNKFASVKISKNKLSHSKAKKIYKKGLVLFAVALVYILLRYIYYPDFPLFFIISHGINGFDLRDVAFYYGSNHNIFYLFLPSINSQFYRILLPASFFIILYYYQNYEKTKKLKIFVLFILIVTLMMNLGTLKRTPILYIATWFTLYTYMYKDNLKYLFNIIFYVVFTVLILVSITSFYSDATMSHILLNLFARFSIGEAIGEFLAIEHFGSTFDYMYFDIFTVYFQKVLGMDVMTFSELWKILSGGSRGYTSIGIIAELYVSFGWVSIVFISIFTLIILKLDIFFKRLSHSPYRAIISGFITIIAFMFVKGFFAQLFTGGIITLIIVYIVLKFNITWRKY